MRLYRHIFICAAIIWAMVGCVKNDIDVEIGEMGQIITLSTSIEATRASVTEDEDFTDEEFKITAFKYSTGYLYYADEVYYSDGAWTSDATRYWPTSDNLDFYAYSPIDKTFIVEEEFVEEEGKTYRDDFSLRYTCPADIDEQVDLLVATSSNQKSDDGDVDLLFLHALSGIKFNVEFAEESNVTLKTININYIGVENERVYNFATESWGESLEKYFDSTSGYSTSIDHNETSTNGGGVTFELDDCLMIIPQPIDEKDQFISIQIEYALIGAQGNSETGVITGTMPLPAPTDDNEYAQGYIYTYNIIVSNDKITFSTISIEDQDDPIAAYGNIDLSLITERSTAAAIGYDDATDAGSQYYYTTAVRVKNLLLDGVRDFVVVGSMGATYTEISDTETTVNTLGNGKLGYYGGISSPFYIGAVLVDLGTDDLFSVDLRGTYDYPRFADANNDTPSVDVTEEVTEETRAITTRSDDTTIDDDEPILIAGMFANIDWLDEVILPQGIAAIGNHAFDNCDALETIDIASVKHIEIGAFQNSLSLVTVSNGSLTRIHDNGFGGCKSLTTIDLSNVTEIDKYGFNNCESLTDVDLSNLSVIGEHAFSGCSELTLKLNTTIPDFTSVADYAFYGCYKLGENGSTINLDDATYVGDHAFADCEHIQLYSGELNDLETVGEYAFSGCSTLGSSGQEFEIPNLVSVEMAGFAKCPYVNIVSGLSNLKSISSFAFQDCTSLTGYASDASESEQILSLPYVTTVESYGFNNAGITNVAFSEDKLTTIGDYAFDSCGSLTTISGLDNVTSVGTYAFSSCTSLENLELPALTDGNWGANFFASCSSLKRVSLPLLTIESITYKNSSGANTESSIISMAKGAEELILSGLEGSIGSYAHFCSYAYNSETEEYDLVENETLQYIDLGSISELVGGTFVSCNVLESADLSSATSIGDWAFSGCAALMSINLGDVETVGSGAFNKCTNLESLNLGLASTIGGQAFSGCTALVSIDLGNAETVGNGAFANCSSLKKLNLSSIVPIDDNNDYWTFGGISYGQCELWLPDSEAGNISGDDNNVWGYVTWSKIHMPSDTDYVEFTLE